MRNGAGRGDPGAGQFASALPKSDLGTEGVHCWRPAETDLHGLPECEDGFALSDQKKVEKHGRNFFATLMCTGVSALALCRNSDFSETGGNSLGESMSTEGILPPRL